MEAKDVKMLTRFEMTLIISTSIPGEQVRWYEQDMTLNDVCEKMRVLHQFKAS
jgi:hypothetical protein